MTTTKNGKVRKGTSENLTPAEVADVFVQAAFLRSRGKGHVMKEIIEGFIHYFPEPGDKSVKRTKKLSAPIIPAKSRIWRGKFVAALRRHAGKIRL